MDAFTGQQANASIDSIKDSRGRDATVDGAPTWQSSDDTVLSVVPAADGMSAVISTGAPGSARVTATADADLGAGIAPITIVFDDVTVSANPNSQASLMTGSLAPFSDTP